MGLIETLVGRFGLCGQQYNHLYSPDEAVQWAERIRAIGVQAWTSHATTNNYFEGKAVTNAFEILAGLGRRPGDVPEELLRRCTQSRAVTGSAVARFEGTP